MSDAPSYPKSCTAFQQAFLEWRDAVLRKKKSHKSRFLLSCNNAILEANGSVTPETIMESIASIESKNAQKFGARTAKKILGPVVAILKDYYGIIDTCCQADPFPSALVWGCLKVIIEGLSRYFDLFDKIRSQLHMLKFQLERLKWFDDLWGESSDMQRYLCSTYVHVFRFWNAVDKECDRISVSALMRATTSFSTKKIQAIINDLSGQVDKVDKLGPIVEARIARGERENSEEERQLAGLERMQNRKERQEAAQFRETVLIEQQAVQQERFYSKISRRLEDKAANKTNIKRHHNNIDDRFGDTCDWLLNASWYEDWLNGSNSDPIIWLHAQPGSGKSVLCSHAMAHVESLPDSPIVAFQFFHFDEQTTARQLLYNIAAQLFKQYWIRYKTVPENIRLNIAEAADDVKDIRALIHLLMPELPRVFIFLDGLDEEDSGARQKEALKILDVVIELTSLFPSSVRFWLSSQDRAIFRNRLQTHAIINVQVQIEAAVQRYLCQALPGLCDMTLDEETQAWALKELQRRADGHFLWATLMIKEIKQSIPSISHLKSFIKKGLPLDLHGYYRRIIARYLPGTEREYAAKILSLVVFARRRLSVNEIVEAIWITSSEIEHKSDLIFVNFIKKLFSPLIVIERDGQDSNNDSCRLFHSTARSFLVNYPTVLQTISGGSDPKLLVSEELIAHACLEYLRQPEYAALLQNTSTDSEQWRTANGEDIGSHYLLRYSAKYWDKHLDNAKETSILRTHVEHFLTSPNFVTLIQLQSLFVELHFGVYTLAGASERDLWLKRVFPQWLSNRELPKSGKPGAQFTKFYRTFVSEWRYFLHRPTCSAHCRSLPHIGEVDRCLWGALGPQSFLSCNKSRYESFMLANGTAPKRRFSRKKSIICVDGFGPDGRDLAVVHYTSRRPLSVLDISFQVEIWNLEPGSAPELERHDLLTFNLEKIHWPGYSAITHGNCRMMPVRFSPDLSFLRVGSRILGRTVTGEYNMVMGANDDNLSIPWYFEEFAARGQYIALVSREKAPKPFVPGDKKPKQTEKATGDDDADSESETLSKPSISSEETPKPPNEMTDIITSKSSSETEDEKSASSTSSDEESETHDVVSESSSISLELDSDGEDWSDGSTDLENIGFSASDDADEISTESTDVSSEHTESSGISDTDEEHPSRGPLGPHFEESDSGKDVDFADDDNNLVYRSDSDGPTFRTITKSTIPQGTITVFDTSQEPPKLLFQYLHALPIMLYESPPVIHPTRPLVVWPLCGGDILFADFIAKSYFVRKSRPTSRHTRHVFMKANFSPDGAYLHLASLEAQQLPKPKISKSNSSNTKKSAADKAKAKPSLQLSLFVTTHRLSQRKTTRSPPNLIHRAKLSLGSFASISVAQMPIFLTWTANELYCTFSSNHFKVFRIGLFRANLSGTTATDPSSTTSIAAQPQLNSNVTVPKNEILLPDTTRVREVRYYPPTSERVLGAILIGSLNPTSHRRIKEMSSSADESRVEELPDVTSPPVGLFVTKDDLGEWVTEEGREEELKGKHGRSGDLERNMEKFDAEDDCDIEIYIS